MSNLYSQFTYDNSLLLSNTGANITATAEGGILDIGDGLFDGFMIVDIDTLDMTTGDEGYVLSLEGSTVAAMTSTSVGLATMYLGNTVIPMDADDAAIVTGAGKRLALPVRNERLGVLYRYVRIHYALTGTTPIIKMVAFLAKR